MTDPAKPEATVETTVTAEASGDAGKATEGEPLFVARTQKDLDKRFGTEKREAAAAKEREIAESLGVTVEEAKQIIADHKAVQEATETEMERLQREVAEKDAAIASANEEKQNALRLADERLVDSEARTALVGSGVDPKRVHKILGDRDLEKPTVSEGKVEGVDDYVEAARKEWPELFKPAATIPGSPEVSSGKLSDEQKEDARRASEQHLQSVF